MLGCLDAFLDKRKNLLLERMGNRITEQARYLHSFTFTYLHCALAFSDYQIDYHYLYYEALIIDQWENLNALVWSAFSGFLLSFI